jgi:hypothetical protein
MQETDVDRYIPTVQIPVMTVAELQDSLLVVLNDLQRLEGLVSHAANNLLERFESANVSLDKADLGVKANEDLGDLRTALHSAIIELQFQDMATQLITHTSKVLKACADRLAFEAMETDEEEMQTIMQPLPDRPNPVTQDEMDAGSVELF